MLKIPVNIGREKRSKDAFKNPLPGDYWNEMFCPYFVILSKTENTLIVCEDTKETDAHHWTWDLEKAIEVPMEYMNRVKYDSIDAFVADVSSSRHLWAISAWQEMGSPYTPIPVVPPDYPADFRTVMDQGV